MTNKETGLVKRIVKVTIRNVRIGLLDLVGKILILIYDKYLVEIKLKVRSEFNPNCWIGGF